MNRHPKAPLNITPAATVILAREHFGKLQIYLLKRSSKSGFMAGNYVFPGGTVEAEDRNFSLFKNHIDLDLNKMHTRLGGELSREEAMAYCVAAIRETLEEAGVFLAVSDDALEANLEYACSLRLSAHLKKDWFAKLVLNAQWRLAISALSCWSHWITPELMKRRFDTRFFVSAMPGGQYCLPDSKETVAGRWLNPKEALTGNLDGKFPLSPPTLVTLHELLKYPSLQDLLAETRHRRWGRPLLPRLIPLANGALIVEPWDPNYRMTEFDMGPDDLAPLVLPVGAPFSRIWHDEGIWKPVRVL